MKAIFKSIFPVLTVGALVLTPGCKKFLEVGSPTITLANNNVFASNSTAAAAVTSLYTGLSLDKQVDGIEIPNTSNTYLGVYGDELALFANTEEGYRPYYQNAINLNSIGGYIPFWTSVYNAIFRVNAIIEGINGSNKLTANVKNHLLGEAYFMRAFFYFHLVNVFGDVPLVLTTDYKVNALLPRTAAATVYEQIIKDLTEARSLLNDKYLGGDIEKVSTERVRPNKTVATALLARVYLYTGNHQQAIEQASSVIDNHAMYELEPVDKVFLKQSREAIWQLQPVNTGFNTRDGQIFILPSTGPQGGKPFHLSKQLLDAFYPGDARRKNWVDSVILAGTTLYYPYKYKKGLVYDNAITSTAQMTEYTMAIRLAEMYLIRAEARLLQNNDANGTIEDINAIRSRAGLGNYTGPGGKEELLKEILRQRQVELFTEWGHRWFDLKRSGKVDEVMKVVTPLKGGVWEPFKKLLPIPLSELDKNPKLVQTTGYN